MQRQQRQGVVEAWEEVDGKLLFWKDHDMRLLPLRTATAQDGPKSQNVVHVDPEERVLVRFGGSRISFSDLGFVLVQRVTSYKNRSKSVRWVISAVPDRPIRDKHVEAFTSARELLAGDSTMGPAAADQAAETQALVSLLNLTEPIVIGSYYDASLAWRAGEKLARTLNLPLLDLINTPTLRRVDQLDLSLQSLLAQDIVPTQAPGLPPEDMAESKGDGLQLSWVRHEPFGIFILGICLFLGMSVYLHDSASLLALLAALLFGIFLVLGTLGNGWQTLVVDGARLSWTGFLMEKTLSSDRIVWIRADEREQSVEFITDEAMLLVRLPSPEATRWLQLRVENHLKGPSA